MGTSRLLSLIFAGVFIAACAHPSMAQEEAAPEGKNPSETDGAQSALQGEVEARKALIKKYEEATARAKQAIADGNDAAPGDFTRFKDAEVIYVQDIQAYLDALGEFAADLVLERDANLATLKKAWAEKAYSNALIYIGENDLPAAKGQLEVAKAQDPQVRYENEFNAVSEQMRSEEFADRTGIDTLFQPSTGDVLVRNDGYTSLSQLQDNNGNTIPTRDLTKSVTLQTQVLLEQARQLIRLSKWAEAKSICEDVFRLEPTNREACYLLEDIYRQVNFAYQFRREADILEAAYDVTERWFVPATTREELMLKPLKTTESVAPGTIELLRKIRNIKVPSVNFQDVPMADVIREINDLNREWDPELQGVEVIYNAPAGGQDTMVNLKLANVPLEYLLKKLSTLSSSKMTLRNGTVLIGSQDVFTQMDYPVRTSFLKTAVEEAEAAGFAAGGEEGTATTSEINATALQHYFTERGVTFPVRSEDSKATVSYSNGKMRVVNTSDNLKLIGMIVADVATSDLPLVSVEARFLEVTRRRLEQLGFHWSFETKSDTGANSTTIGRDVIQNAFGLSGDVSYGSYTPQVEITFPNRMLLGMETDIKLGITALDQNGTAEELSAPKIITQSGEVGVIRMVQERYFPTSWDEPTLEDTEIGVKLKPALPQFDAPEDLGITLEVTPQVAPNSNLIELDLKPKVTEFTGWEIYDYLVTIPGNNSPDKLEVKMPIIRENSYTTKLFVYNGETVTLGGIMRDYEYVDDFGYPILGDLPLVGRLFKDIREHSQKTNLMIYVTARVMNEDGSPTQSERPPLPTGTVNFNR